jgi:Alanyl-tRNA synthetase
MGAPARSRASTNSRQAALGNGGPAEQAPQDVDGVAFIAQSLKGIPTMDLDRRVDAIKGQIGSSSSQAIAKIVCKPAVPAGVAEDDTGMLEAIYLARAASAEIGGKGGGGRPDFAQAGGSDPSKAEEAIRAAEAALGG